MNVHFLAGFRDYRSFKLTYCEKKTQHDIQNRPETYGDFVSSCHTLYAWIVKRF